MAIDVSDYTPRYDGWRDLCRTHDPLRLALEIVIAEEDDDPVSMPRPLPCPDDWTHAVDHYAALAGDDVARLRLAFEADDDAFGEPASELRAVSLMIDLLDRAVDRLAAAAVKSTTGGHARGAQKRAEGARTRAEVHRLARQWEDSDDLQDQHETATAYIRTKLTLSEKHIRRHLKSGI